MLPLPSSTVCGKPKIRLATMLVFSRNIALCPLIRCKLLEVLRSAAEEVVELAILGSHTLVTKLTVGGHSLIAPYNSLEWQNLVQFRDHGAAF
jgi:hypothetical protein